MDNCFTDGVNGDQVGNGGSPIDPLLGPLQENGGPTFTHAVLAGSPVIDAGNDTGAPATDQRGAPRIVDGPDADSIATTDIGAFEFGTFFVNSTADAVDATALGDGVVDVDLGVVGNP